MADDEQGDENRFSTRLRDDESIQLKELADQYNRAIEPFKANIAQDDRLTAAQKEKILSMSHHQMIHYVIQYCHIKRHDFIPIVVKMARAGMNSMVQFEQRFGLSIESSEMQARYLAENEADLSSGVSFNYKAGTGAPSRGGPKKKKK